ncbi:unnamed protein product [Moneuplotes crassus]|uniref:Uncharacterized protein n=1 Tax=Euplotes crassus TaxID=5936 RepID=A0AAD1UDJ4_EUPCR|nr:unnamed protein product [Moneuplotes crassus]
MRFERDRIYCKSRSQLGVKNLIWNCIMGDKICRICEKETLLGNLSSPVVESERSSSETSFKIKFHFFHLINTHWCVLWKKYDLMLIRSCNLQSGRSKVSPSEAL